VGTVRCYTPAGTVYIAATGRPYYNNEPNHDYHARPCEGGVRPAPPVNDINATPRIFNQVDRPNIWAGYAIQPQHNSPRYSEMIGQWDIPNGYSSPIRKPLSEWVGIGGRNGDVDNAKYDALHQNGTINYSVCYSSGSAATCAAPDSLRYFYFLDQLTTIDHNHNSCGNICPATILAGPAPQPNDTIVAYVQERIASQTVLYGWINETSGELTTIIVPGPAARSSQDVENVIEDSAPAYNASNVLVDFHQASYPDVRFGPVRYAITPQGSDIAFAAPPSSLFKHVMGGDGKVVVLPSVPGNGGSFVTQNTKPFIVLSKAEATIGDKIVVSGYYFDPKKEGGVFIYQTVDTVDGNCVGINRPLGYARIHPDGTFSIPRAILPTLFRAKGRVVVSYYSFLSKEDQVVASAPFTILQPGTPPGCRAMHLRGTCRTGRPCLQSRSTCLGRSRSARPCPRIAVTSAVNPEIGGVLSGEADGEQVSVDVPGDAVSAITLLTATVPTAAPLASPGSILEGDAFDFAETNDVGTAVTTFTAPITMTFSYSPTISDADATRLRIEYYDTSTDSWTPLPDPDILDMTQHTVSAQTDHFMLYGLFLTPNGAVYRYLMPTATRRDARTRLRRVADHRSSPARPRARPQTTSASAEARRQSRRIAAWRSRER